MEERRVFTNHHKMCDYCDKRPTVEIEGPPGHIQQYCAKHFTEKNPGYRVPIRPAAHVGKEAGE